VTFGMCMSAFAKRHRSSNHDTGARHLYAWFWISVALFTIATLSEILQFVYVLQAFLWYKGPGGPSEMLSDPSFWMVPAKAGLSIAQILVGDAALVSSLVFSSIKLPCMLIAT
jgi:hypothetical protein